MDDGIAKTVHGIGELNDKCCYRPNGSRISNYVVYIMYGNILVFEILYNVSRDLFPLSEIMII